MTCEMGCWCFGRVPCPLSGFLTGSRQIFRGLCAWRNQQVGGFVHVRATRIPYRVTTPLRHVSQPESDVSGLSLVPVAHLSHVLCARLLVARLRLFTHLVYLLRTSAKGDAYVVQYSPQTSVTLGFMLLP